MRSTPFRHEALFYAGMDDFLAHTVPFVRAAVAGEEPILVAVGADKIARLRGELNGEADHVLFADMARLGVNPARIIPAWREFIARRGAEGRPVRGIGEPIWPGRGDAELAECRRHEALLNLAFAETPAFWLVCPYDADGLDDEVLEGARHSHPLLVEEGASRASDAYDGLDQIVRPFDEPLPAPPATAGEITFGADGLLALRTRIADAAREAGLSARRTQDVVLAVHELVTNSVRHGGGMGVLRVWSDDGAFVCEVRDGGRIDDPLVGRRRPDPLDVGGYGVWLANQLCELVQVRSFADGSVVRVHARG